MLAVDLLNSSLASLMNDQPSGTKVLILGTMSHKLAWRHMLESGELPPGATEPVLTNNPEDNLVFWKGCRLYITPDKKNTWVAMWVGLRQ